MREVALPEPERRARDYRTSSPAAQRQRILIAMAIVNRPRLPIVDPPINGPRCHRAGADTGAAQGTATDPWPLHAVYLDDPAAVAEACDQPGDRVAVMQHGGPWSRPAQREPFARPRHAYTRRLLASAPTMASDRMRPLAVETLSGERIADRSDVFCPSCMSSE